MWCGPTREVLLANVARVRALRGADLVEMLVNSRLAPAQVYGRGLAARPPHQVGGCGIGPSVIPCSTFAERGPRAYRPVKKTAVRPQSKRVCTARCGLDCGAGQLATHSSATLHARVHCAVWTWLSCGPTRDALLARGAHARALRGADLVVVRANVRRARPELVGRGSAARPPHHAGGCGFEPSVILRSTPVAPLRHCRTATASGWRLGLRIVGDTTTGSCGARPPRSSPRGESANRPRSTSTYTARCGHGCGEGQLATRSSRARRPRLARTATASCRRLRLRTVGDTASDPRGALTARPHGYRIRSAAMASNRR